MLLLSPSGFSAMDFVRVGHEDCSVTWEMLLVHSLTLQSNDDLALLHIGFALVFLNLFSEELQFFSFGSLDFKVSFVFGWSCVLVFFGR